jgi:hypothetical protein
MLKLLCRKTDRIGINLAKKLMKLRKNKESIVYTKRASFVEINGRKISLYYDKNKLRKMLMLLLKVELM